MAISIIQLNSHEEWLEHRRNYIGGSEASCIVGMNPYKTNVELWEEKTGRVKAEDISSKSYVRYGTLAEEPLRELFKLDFPQYEVKYIDNNSVLNDKYSFAAASLDGFLIEKETGRKGVFECKTTNILNSMSKEKWRDRLPDNYYIQCIHYLMVTGFDFVILKAQLKYTYPKKLYLTTEHYLIEREEVEADIEYLAQEERKFANCIKNDTRPNLVLPNL